MSLLSPGTKPNIFRFKDKDRKIILSWKVDWKIEGGIGEFTFYRTYSRKKNDGSLENWNDCVIRVIEGMMTIQKTYAKQSHIPWSEIKSNEIAIEAAERMFLFKWTPPGRGLWMMGTDYIWKNGAACLNNCAFVSTRNISSSKDEFSKPFTFLMDASMVGVGVGFDSDGEGCVIKGHDTKIEELIIVEDSREGWVQALRRVLESHFSGSNSIALDVSKVRKKGTPIIGFGGIASGPDPLVRGLRGVSSILYEVSKRDNNYLNSVDITDIMNLIGRLVVSGNVRRSSEISFSKPDDKEFSEMKDGTKYPSECGWGAPEELKYKNLEDYNKYNENMGDPEILKTITDKYENEDWGWKFGGWRWNSNNSIFVENGEDYTKYEESIGRSGEPGFAWLDDMREYGRMKDKKNYKDIRVKGGNPCLEQSLESFELCCLVENFPSHCESNEDFIRTLKFSYMYAKTVTLMATGWEESNSIIARNRRIGSSLSGATDAMVKFGRNNFFQNFCDKGYDYLKCLDKEYSDWFGVPKSIKMTSAKPSGTVSLVAGVYGPGIHYPKLRSGYRLIRLASNSQFIQRYIDAGYRVERSVTEINGTSIIYFPWITPDKFKVDEETTIWEQFKNASDFQNYWADNQVSCTIGFSEEELNTGQISSCLEAFDSGLKGISLLKRDNSAYPQMPFTSAPREEVLEYISGLSIVNFSDLKNEGEDSDSNKYCEGDSCTL